MLTDQKVARFAFSEPCFELLICVKDKAAKVLLYRTEKMKMHRCEVRKSGGCNKIY